jgi:ketosteroid isomerase-like protein
LAQPHGTCGVSDDQYAELQKNFAEAYNRKDADAMATAVAQDGITVTPSGILQGRDAIRRNLQDVSGTARLLDHRTPSRAINRYVDSTPIHCS